MRLSFILFFVFKLFTLSAQPDFRKTYFPLINKAELLFIEEKYTDASESYFKAFSQTKSPLVRDLLNATVCKLYQGDFEGAKLYLFKMAQRGVNLETLEQLEIFEIGNNQDAWKMFKPSYEQFYEPKELNDFLKYHFSNLSLLRSKLMDMLSENFILIENGADEQKFAIKRKDYSGFFSSISNEAKENIRVYTKAEMEKESIVIKINTEEIYHEAKEILLLIMENQMALSDGTSQVETFHTHDHDMFSFLNFFMFNKPQIIVENGKAVNKLADWMNEEEISYLDSRLQEAVSQGILSPQLAISQSSERDIPEKIRVTSFTLKIENNNNCNKEFDDLDNVKFLKKNTLTKDEQKEYNKIRQKYGLETLEDRFKKEEFAIDQNKYFILNTRSTLESSVVPNCEVAQNMIAGATIVHEK
ncbi:hypothetical protein EGI22_05665 [Lacihabitans sp. LS3-19]|uniref:hypothetical protein n=1 Tax=Lacihabitans sp. LS3-19 TaxID=2487335 RepID=UPI0020CC1B24|nr:hypothetical protein [Lacihabitans sp. LS3-19]MCP9767389.1 hypothetical protein [Lacihabitans sp. LS3-19]